MVKRFTENHNHKEKRIHQLQQQQQQKLFNLIKNTFCKETNKQTNKRDIGNFYFNIFSEFSSIFLNFRIKKYDKTNKKKTKILIRFI